MTSPSDSAPKPSPPDASTAASDSAVSEHSPGLPPPPTLNADARRSEMRYHWIFLIAAVLILFLSFLFNFESGSTVAISVWGHTLPSLCTFRNLTGWDCPGCGMTRSFVSLAQGDWSDSLGYHPLGWLAFGIVLLQIPFRGVQLARLRRGLQPLYWPAVVWLGWAFMVLLLVQWVIRGVMRG